LISDFILQNYVYYTIATAKLTVKKLIVRRRMFFPSVAPFDSQLLPTFFPDVCAADGSSTRRRWYLRAPPPVLRAQA
jgi:hypothetical protein